MKSNTHFKIALMQSLLIAAALIGTYSCTNNDRASCKRTLIMELGNMNSVVVTDADMNFMNEATEVNLEEIRLSEVALQRSKNVEIRELGKKLTNQHYQSLLDLTALATSKNIIIPTKLGDKENMDYEKLNHMSGGTLDREYIMMMVKEHQYSIALFEKESKIGTDPDIKKWATMTLPGMHTHLDYAVACQGILPMCTDSNSH